LSARQLGAYTCWLSPLFTDVSSRDESAYKDDRLLTGLMTSSGFPVTSHHRGSSSSSSFHTSIQHHYSGAVYIQGGPKRYRPKPRYSTQHSSNTDRFSLNSFTVTFSRKFAMKRLLNLPPHLKHVATLPCEIIMSAN